MPLQRLLQRLSAASPESENAPLADNADSIVGIVGDELEKMRQANELGALERRVNEMYTACRNARRMDEIQWYKNIDMYQGRQFTSWNDSQERMVEPARLPHQPRIAVNFIEPIVRTEMAKTGGSKPMATVSPASNDMDDILAAQAGESIWEWLYSTEKFQTRVFVPANWWRTVTGLGFIKTYYDTSTVDPAAKAGAIKAAKEAAQQAQKQAEQQAQATGIPALTQPAQSVTVQVAAGKIAIDPVTPFNFLVPDMAEPDLQRQPYVLHVYTRNAEQAKMIYGDSLPAGESLSTVASNEIINLTHLGIRGGNPAKPDSVLIIEAWIKPGFVRELPKGGLVILVGGKIVQLHNEGIPYEHGEYPFAMLTGIESGRFVRKSVIESLVGLQDELNLTYAQIIKRKNMASNPQFFYQDKSLDPRKVTSRPGLFIPIKLGMKFPESVPITEAPAYVQNLIDRIRSHVEDISGQHQATRGEAIGANTAASAYAMLQESDDNYLSTTFQSIEAALEQTGRHGLALAVQYWDEPRLVRVVGMDGAFDSQLIKGADIASGTDLRVESGTGLPVSKAAKVATVTEWMEKGIIPVDIGLEVIEMGTLGKLFDRVKVDREQASRENIEMRDLDVETVKAFFAQQQQATEAFQQNAIQQGADQATIDAAMQQQPMPGFYPIGWMDNDPVHIQIHKDYAKSQAFKTLPPEIQQVYERHTQDHEMREAEAQAQQAALAIEQTPGAPAGSEQSAQPALTA